MIFKLYCIIFICHFFRKSLLDVYSTVTKMNSQGMSMLVETPEQYLDIFQCLKDEICTNKLPPGYYDLDLIKRRYAGYSDHDSGRPSLEEDEFIYPEESDREEVEVVAYYTNIVTTEERKDAHDSTKKGDTANYTIENRIQPKEQRIRTLPLD